jgi:transcriptional regulator with GAF, ATPase, and Fis domain
VKLLRVLQSRIFQRLGDTETRRFQGKIIAATNRDLAREMREGRFREDFYYRICSDMITTPTLHEQLLDSPVDLRNLIEFISARLAGVDEAENLAEEVEKWVASNLPRDYRWPGNVRELEQCVRNILVRKSYNPPEMGPRSPREELSEAFWRGSITADELLSRYCTLVYSMTGNYQETARRLQLDHRTVKVKIDARLLSQLGGARAKEPAD